MTNRRIQEVFVPPTVNTVEGLIAFLVAEIIRAGGDPATVDVLDTREAIPNVEHSDEWPCMTLKFDMASDGECVEKSNG